MPLEHQPQPKIELAPELVTAYAKTFMSRYDRYSRQNLDGSYLAVPWTLTLPTIEAHLRGQITIGAYALDEQSQAHWVCLDADETQEWDALRTLAGDLVQQSVPAYLETSRRGGHLWLFFAHPIPGVDARRFARELIKDRGIDRIEIYPRQDRLATGPGSLVRLPLGLHRKDTPPHRYSFVRLSGEPLAPTVREQLAMLAHPATVPTDYLHHILSRAPESTPVFPTPRFKKGKRSRSGTPSERIKNAVSVHEFVSQFVDLDKSGRGLCPFHDDHRQSFSVHQDNNFWYCFAGCGGGSVIDFWMKWRVMNGNDGSFTASITDLAHRLLE